MELSERKIAAQFQLLVEAAETVLAGMFGKRVPADRELAAFYRANRQCGSRDRAFINRTVYTLLRHWGWARKLAGKQLVSDLENGKALPSERDVSAMIFFALACAGNDPESISSAARIIGVRLPGGIAALPREKRAAAAAGELDIAMTFDENELLPEWSRPLLPEGFSRRMTERPPMWLRINKNGKEHVLEELAAADVAVETFPEFPEAAAVSAPSVNLAALSCFQKGEVEVQDLASQGIVRFCAPRRKERWFDPCAGAGGKTLAIAEAMGRTGTVVAGDVRERILVELRRRARRSGYPNIVTRCHDGRPWRGLKPFDGVLIDAPCSCSGVWRRAPWGPWTTKEADIAKYAEKQTGILDAFSPCVKPGGVLVYATCSAFRRENEEVVAHFLGTHPDFVLSRAPDPFTGAPGDGFMHMPEGFDCDIMFAAKMERKG